jgi:hypothetical protein
LPRRGEVRIGHEPGSRRCWGSWRIRFQADALGDSGHKLLEALATGPQLPGHGAPLFSGPFRPSIAMSITGQSNWTGRLREVGGSSFFRSRCR